MTEKKDEKQGTTLAQSLVAIAREIKDPAKDAKNPHFGNKYASLDATIGEIRELAAKHGVAIMQSSEYIYVEGTTTYTETRWDKYEKREITTTTVYPNSYIRLVTELIHESGETKTVINSIPLTKPEPQAYGGSLTYDRRYADQAAFNVTGETDDDANSTKEPVNKPAKRFEEHIDRTEQMSVLSPPDSRWENQNVKVEPPEGGDRDKLAVDINEMAKIIAEHKGQSTRDVIADASSFKDKDGKNVPGFTDPMEMKRDGVTYKASLKWLGGTLKNMRDYCAKNGLEVTE